jgi:hypothetical protein
MDQRLDDVLEHHPVGDAATVAAQRMVGVELATVGRQRGELGPDGFQQR